MLLSDHHQIGSQNVTDGTFDLVMSSQSIHWVNDLPSVFQEVFRVLKPDGCFMFSMIGGATLPELRVSMVLAELAKRLSSVEIRCLRPAAPLIYLSFLRELSVEGF